MVERLRISALPVLILALILLVIVGDTLSTCLWPCSPKCHTPSGEGDTLRDSGSNAVIRLEGVLLSVTPLPKCPTLLIKLSINTLSVKGKWKGETVSQVAAGLTHPQGLAERVRTA